MAILIPEILAVVSVVILASVCKVNGETCNYRSTVWGIYFTKTKECIFGCCIDDCCTASVGLIVGLIVAAGILIFVAIVVICVCHRRRNGGVVHRRQAAVVVQQSSATTVQGGVFTSGIPSGMIYPPTPQYSSQFPTSNSSYPPPYGSITGSHPGTAPPPAYTSQLTPCAPPEHFFQPLPYPATPPSYDSLPNASTGVINLSYDTKN